MQVSQTNIPSLSLTSDWANYSKWTSLLSSIVTHLCFEGCLGQPFSSIPSRIHRILGRCLSIPLPYSSRCWRSFRHPLPPLASLKMLILRSEFNQLPFLLPTLCHLAWVSTSTNRALPSRPHPPHLWAQFRLRYASPSLISLWELDTLMDRLSSFTPSSWLLAVTIHPQSTLTSISLTRLNLDLLQLAHCALPYAA